MSIKLLVVDDHAIFRECVSRCLNMDDKIDIIGQCASGEEVLSACRLQKPDVVLMDVSMPGMNGIETTQHLMKEFPEIKVIALTMHVSRNIVASMLKAGAAGFLNKADDYREMSFAIRAVTNGRKYCGTSCLEVMNKDQAGTADNVPLSVVLTKRERDVMAAMVDGASTKEIAGRLSISVDTVATHRRHLMKKLNVNNVADLIRNALLREEGSAVMYTRN